MKRFPASPSRAHGFSLIEVMVVVAVFGIMMLAAYGSLRSAAEAQATGSRLVDLRSSAIRALREIAADLRQTGRVDLSPPTGRVYPYFFSNGAATGYFAAASHSSPKNHAMPGSQASGVSSEIIYVLPRDLDGDGTRINASTGLIEWGPEDWSIALLTQPDGTNVLCRRKDGAVDRILAAYVDRVALEDYQADPALGYNQVRIRIYMVFNDNVPAHYLETSVATTVDMRNFQED